MIRRPPRSTLSSSSAASDVYKRQGSLCPVHLSTTPSISGSTPSQVCLRCWKTVISMSSCIQRPSGNPVDRESHRDQEQNGPDTRHGPGGWTKTPGPCRRFLTSAYYLSFVSVQPNAVTIETGLLLGLKARVNVAQGASPGLHCPQKKLLGSMCDFIP